MHLVINIGFERLSLIGLHYTCMVERNYYLIAKNPDVIQIFSDFYLDSVVYIRQFRQVMVLVFAIILFITVHYF